MTFNMWIKKQKDIYGELQNQQYDSPKKQWEFFDNRINCVLGTARHSEQSYEGMFQENKDSRNNSKKEEEAKKAAETPEIATASVIAVGDNLYHSKLYESGEYDSGNWNYDHIYANVLDEIQAADVAMIDQETMPGTRINQLLKHYAQQPELLDLAYELVLACKGGK